MIRMKLIVAVSVMGIMASFVAAQDTLPIAPVASTANVRLAPVALPGKGLAQHDFLYAGEGNDQRI